MTCGHPKTYIAILIRKIGWPYPPIIYILKSVPPSANILSTAPPTYPATPCSVTAVWKKFVALVWPSEYQEVFEVVRFLIQSVGVIPEPAHVDKSAQTQLTSGAYISSSAVPDHNTFEVPHLQVPPPASELPDMMKETDNQQRPIDDVTKDLPQEFITKILTELKQKSVATTTAEVQKRSDGT